MGAEMSAFMQEKKIHPQIAASFEFKDAEVALDAVANSNAPGKIVIRV